MTESKYIKLYNILLEKIEKKEFAFGDKLPSERELIEQYNVSRDTVRKSLNLLLQDGYIEKAKGKVATVLNKNQFKFPISQITSFKELHTSVSTKTYVENLEIVSSNEDTDIAEKLNLKKGEEAFKLIRIREIEGEKIIIDKDYFSRKYIPNLPLKAAQNSVYEYLENELGLKISYCTKEITVHTATEEDKRLLDMNNYNMIVVVKSFTYLENSKLFQYTESRHRPDKFKFIDYAYREHKKISTI